MNSVASFPVTNTAFWGPSDRSSSNALVPIFLNSPQNHKRQSKSLPILVSLSNNLSNQTNKDSLPFMDGTNPIGDILHMIWARLHSKKKYGEKSHSPFHNSHIKFLYVVTFLLSRFSLISKQSALFYSGDRKWPYLIPNLLVRLPWAWFPNHRTLITMARRFSISAVSYPDLTV